MVSHSGNPPSPRATPSLRQAGRQMLRLMRVVRPFWSPFLRGILVALILGGVSMVTPWGTKLLVDEVYPNQDSALMHVVVLGLLAFGLATTLMGGLHSYFSLFIHTHLSNSTRLMFFNHLQHLPMRFFDTHQVGEINSRFQDMGRALEAVGRVINTVFVQGIYLLLVPPVLFYLDWRLAAIALISVPLTAGLTAFTGALMRRRWQRASEAFADLNAFQIETLSHVRTFKTMALEGSIYRRGRGMIEHAMAEQLRAGGMAQGFGVINGVLRGLNTALFTWFGWRLILRGDMTLGDFFAFSAYLGFLYGPIQQFIQLFSDFQQSAVHLDRMWEYLDAEPEQDPTLAFHGRQEESRPLRGDFELCQVTFGYHAEQPVLQDINLSFAAGQVTAVVGLSGSGKTSMLRLLAGLEHPQEGTVKVDGRPVDVDLLPELRRQIAVVWQDVSLIKGSLWENLILGCHLEDGAEPPHEEVQQAIDLCGLRSVVDDMPDGLATHVAEWGSSLSAGQRQRVALARAMLRRAPILLLDEATANIDVETEMAILRRVFQAKRDAAIIFVTHRLASASLADRICVMEGGRVMGFGEHRALLDTCPTYRRLQLAAGGTAELTP